MLQIAAVLAIALYLVRWRRSVRRRNAQSWETLLARLRPEWSARELSEQFLWKEGLSATPEDAWQRMEGPRGLVGDVPECARHARNGGLRSEALRGRRSSAHRDSAQRRDADSRMRADGSGAICVHARRRRCSRECVPRCRDVHRHGGPHDAIAAGITQPFRFRISSQQCKPTSSLLKQEPRPRPGFFTSALSSLPSLSILKPDSPRGTC